MKRAAIIPLSLALGSILLGAARKPILGYADPFPVRHRGIAGGTIARALAIVSPSKHVDDDEVMAVRRRLLEHQGGTYIGEILLERDSSLARWPDRAGTPLTVWVQPNAAIHDFSTSFVARVREAFLEWDSVHLPVRFSFVSDSANADVHVNWIDRFGEPISGRTRWARDDEWMITDANIVLAVHHSRGDALDDDAMQAMALHEIGHLLGLDHTSDSLSIMAPRVRVRQLSDADRATARLLYDLPAGPLR
ncbi:MAG: peptidase and matrixin and adamalysin [Gemmatimonadetes bacterium]|nr:peptidase and matrixin and adamalysin [Gemmatimonadota bacterium]